MPLDAMGLPMQGSRSVCFCFLLVTIFIVPQCLALFSIPEKPVAVCLELFHSTSSSNLLFFWVPCQLGSHGFTSPDLTLLCPSGSSKCWGVWEWKVPSVVFETACPFNWFHVFLIYQAKKAKEIVVLEFRSEPCAAQLFEIRSIRGNMKERSPMIEARSAGPTTGPGEGRLATNTMIIFDSCFCLKAWKATGIGFDWDCAGLNKLKNSILTGHLFTTARPGMIVVRTQFKYIMACSVWIRIHWGLRKAKRNRSQLPCTGWAFTAWTFSFANSLMIHDSVGQAEFQVPSRWWSVGSRTGGSIRPLLPCRWTLNLKTWIWFQVFAAFRIEIKAWRIHPIRSAQSL